MPPAVSTIQVLFDRGPAEETGQERKDPKMNNTSQQTLSHFSEPFAAALGPDQAFYGHSPVTLNVSYRNHLPHPITVVWRSGLKFTLPPLPSMVEKRLLIRVDIGMLPMVRQELVRFLSAVDESSTPELRAMREALLTQLGNKSGGARIVLDYPLGMEDLRSAGGSVYCHDTDVLVSMLALDQVPPHPYSVMGSCERLVQVHADQLKGSGFGYTVSVVDNQGAHGDRFINIAGKVYKIPAARDTTKRDGIYVVSNAPVQGAYGVIGPEVKHYPFEGAEETLGIYRTPEEAATLGDLQGARKRELLEMEHQVQLSRKNLQEAEAKHSKEKADLEADNRRLQAQADKDKAELDKIKTREEQERQRIKDYYEDRSYVRKDSNEALKMVPSIIVGIGALIALFKAVM
jgi:cell division protein FtsB